MGGHVRFDVTSEDGTPIAVWGEGRGAPLVMVHGALSDHTRFDALVAALQPHVAVSERDWVYEPSQFGAVGAPTLVLAGADSPPAQRAATRQAAEAIPGARIQVLDGHGHFAFQTEPELVAGIIREFLSSP